VTGIYNSAVVPWKGGSSACSAPRAWTAFRTCTSGRSPDGLKFTFEPKPIDLTCDDPEVRRFEYAYDPRVTLVDGVHYVTWCNGYHGPTIGIARTKDFVHFEQLENAFLPYNRNGVLFPRKFGKNFLMLSRPSDTGHTPFGDIFRQREPGPRALGQAPPRDRPRRPVVAGHQDRRGPLADRDERGLAPLLPRRHDDLQRLRLLDRRDAARPREPWKVIACANQPLIVPEAPYELTGFVPGSASPWAACATPRRAASRSTTAPPTPSRRSASATPGGRRFIKEYPAEEVARRRPAAAALASRLGMEAQFGV
jgi:beta-1,4-mannooligosaccharide/beta-1,4-mannosyl-N-acetylglucosamine phosphorylase